MICWWNWKPSPTSKRQPENANLLTQPTKDKTMTQLYDITDYSLDQLYDYYERTIAQA